MTKPDETTTSGDGKAPESDNPAEGGNTAPESGKKPAAEPGTLTSTDTGPGDGTPAAAGGGHVEPAESTLVGDGHEGHPAASPKPGASEAAKTDSADMAEAGTDKVDPDEAAPRETPALVPAPTQQVTVKKTGFWPVALGGVVAAGIGAAATIWALPHLPAAWLPEQPAPEAAAAIDADAIRADSVSAAEAAARAEVEGLRSEVDALRTELAEATRATAPTTTPEAAPVAAPADDGSATAERLAALQARLDEQAGRLDELAARPVLDPEMAQRVQSLADQAGALEQQIQSAAETAQTQISAAQVEAQKLQEAAADSTRRAEAVAAIAALQSALDRGVTPDEARQTLEDAGLDAPEALAREVPSLERLQAGFSEAARAALRAALREESASGGNVLTNFLRAQTGARSVDPREGGDPDAILSRAGAEVEAGRIGAALDEMAALPEPARAAPAMADWLAGASAYRDAQSALSDLSANSN